jgi:transcriptional regulator with PAS, ATPase and Fis domain
MGYRKKTTDKRLGKILSFLMEEICASFTAVLCFDEKNQLCVQETRHNCHAVANSLKLGVAGEAIEKGNPVVSVCQLPGVMAHVVSLPLFVGAQPIGAIYFSREDKSGEFTRKEIELLAAFSRPIAHILKKSIPDHEFPAGAANKGTVLLGRSRAHFQVLRLIGRIKNSQVPVLISGESGTGKELVARMIHRYGNRNTGSFVALNCGAIPDHLLESELFGYARGAFTGAVREKPGLIEEAHRGTFFMDEIGDLSLPLQAKLLRVLQEKEIRRIGENRMRCVDVRFISATNKDIENEVLQGRFREDLFYRIKIVSIDLLPLRERREDILSLLNHLVEKYCTEMRRERIYFSPRAQELLMNYSWPGNVRELQNEIQRCLVLCSDGNLIKEEHLSGKICGNNEKHHSIPLDYFQAKAEFEKKFLNEALARSSYNRTRTAEEIGLSRQGLFKLMKKHGIDLSCQE